MTPDITNHITNHIRNRKTKSITSTTKSNSDKKLSSKITSKNKYQFLNLFKRLFNILTVLVFIIVFSLAFIIIVPWEDWIFEEGELDKYINTYSDNEGEWVVRQFMATSDQNLSEPIFHEVECYDKGYKMERNFNAAPQTCGIVVTDTLLSSCKIARLRNIARRITEEIGFQSYSNRESINLKWMNLHILFQKNKTSNVLKKKDYKLIKKASDAAKTMIANSFGLPEEHLHFFVVSQFTRYRSVVPFSEFRHVDKVRSPALVVTSILWLSTTDVDFGGGRVEFLNADDPEPFTPLLIEPKTGRFAAWTSGWENPHGVMEVQWGDRLALIFAFTVNPKLGYKDLDNLKHYGETTKEVY